MSQLFEQPIYNRWTGQVQFTASIEADETTPLGVRRGLAVRWAIENGASLIGANLSHADLIGADLSGAILSEAILRWAILSGASLSWANLSGADLSEVNLRGVNLIWAILSGASLRWADLSNADLRWADLSNADLREASLTGASLSGAKLRGDTLCRLIACVQREIDPYQFAAFELEGGGVKILAGCHWLSIPEYREHVATAYPDTPKADETLAILDVIAARAAALGVATLTSGSAS